MTVALLARDLMIASRIAVAAQHAGVTVVRVTEPAALPPAPEIALLLVDWAERSPWWGEQLAAWRATAAESKRPRIVLFGPHVDLEAHAAARAAGLSPMWARSRLVGQLPRLLSTGGR